jgi:hypothetical protein
MALVPTPTMTPDRTRALPTKNERQRLRAGAMGVEVLMRCSVND